MHALLVGLGLGGRDGSSEVPVLEETSVPKALGESAGLSYPCI